MDAGKKDSSSYEHRPIVVDVVKSTDFISTVTPDAPIGVCFPTKCQQRQKDDVVGAVKLLTPYVQ